MHSIRIHKLITLIISVFYRIGFWHRGDKPTAKEMRIKLFYCVYHSLFVLSFLVGAIESENQDEAIFLMEVSIGTAVLSVKLWIFIWNQSKILNFLHRVCVFSIRNDDDYNCFNFKLRGFMKFVLFFVTYVTVTNSLVSIVLPLLGSDRNMFLKIGFPLDYGNSEVAFWIATIFIFTETLLSAIVVIFGTIVWYLLLNCFLRYTLLGSELKNIGRINEKGNKKLTKMQLHTIFFEDLKASINAHLRLKQLVDDLGSFFADLFFVQFATSGLCICGSVYCLAFDIGDNLLERFAYLFVFLYYLAEIFMITYFGNEIMLSSKRLSYSLFESNWYEQPQLTKECVIIFGEYLKQPQVLMIGKLYPLTLETFTRILNSAYSMFNILKSFK